MAMEIFTNFIYFLEATCSGPENKIQANAAVSFLRIVEQL